MKLLARVGDLRRESRIELLERCFAACSERPTFRLVQYSIQGNHVHMLVEAKDKHSLARGIQGLCIRIAKALNRLMGTRGRVFEERYHMRILRTPREVRSALAYVLNNGASHAARRGLRFVGQQPDPASSGRYFDGWARPDWPLPTADPSLAPVRPARTWLLASGWRRHGLIVLGAVSAGPGGGRGATARPPTPV